MQFFGLIHVTRKKSLRKPANTGVQITPAKTKHASATQINNAPEMLLIGIILAMQEKMFFSNAQHLKLVPEELAQT
jgi:hypothetical protein